MKLFPVCFNIVVFTDHFEIDSAFHATLNAAQPRKKCRPENPSGISSIFVFNPLLL